LVKQLIYDESLTTNTIVGAFDSINTTGYGVTQVMDLEVLHLVVMVVVMMMDLDIIHLLLLQQIQV
jgi:hypothetical protein